MNIDLHAQDEALRREADALLVRHGLLDLLASFGTPHVSGSYSLRLMTVRELDIYLEMPTLDAAMFFRLGERLAETLRPHKMSFADYVHFQPMRGLCWSIQTNQTILAWRLHLWAVTATMCAERLAKCAAMGARLTAERRMAILSIESVIRRAPEFGSALAIQDVYDSVLNSDARSVADFWQYVRAHHD